MAEVTILLGAPGAGKGTASERLIKRLGYEHVATGDMLREALKEGTALGLKAEQYMKRGELVPDEVIIQLVEERLDKGGRRTQFLFDGFPRTLAQAELLQKAVEKRRGKVAQVFLLDAPREVLIQRLTGRRICRSCGANFHVTNMPPKKPGICDSCGGELYHRPDDTETTIANRLDVYTTQTQPLISHYEGQGVLVRVDSSRQVDGLVAEIVGAIERRGARQGAKPVGDCGR